jgi:outer membrane protein OmpA-like peptidoglycan-associated protein
LDKFSKKLIPFLYANKDIIEILEVNGHTSSEWGDVTFTNRYLKNAKLSMNRSYSTLSYIFLNQEKMTQIWLSEIIKGSGLSYAKNVVLNEVEDKEKSRRVSFKIILK